MAIRGVAALWVPCIFSGTLFDKHCTFVPKGPDAGIRRARELYRASGKRGVPHCGYQYAAVYCVRSTAECAGRPAHRAGAQPAGRACHVFSARCF